jgi:anaerobic nitric oxide reductase transcription regulator
LAVPPLRERGEDIALLGGYFCDLVRRRVGVGPVRLDGSAIDALVRYPWPGNVRELENVLSRVVLRQSAKVPRGEPIVISGRHLAADLGNAEITAPEPALPPKTARPRSLSESASAHKRQLVEKALAEQHGNYAAAARALGMDRGNFHRLAKRLGMRV